MNIVESVRLLLIFQRILTLLYELNSLTEKFVKFKCRSSSQVRFISIINLSLILFLIN